MVAGLEEPTVGSIHLGDTDITTTRPYQRPINTVFQNYALFPHLTIFENIAFGLRRRGIKDVKEQVDKVLSLVELPHLAERKPTQLSGGQQQRIALARAIVNRPALLLLDEPLGALDLKLRRQMQIELKWIQREVGLTFVHVTHDQEEAMTMADTIAVMNEGKIEQMGSPADLYDNPETAFVANFLGQSNLIKGKIDGNDGENLVVDLYGQKISMPKKRSHAIDNSLYAGIRPEKFRISRLATAVKGNVPQSDMPSMLLILSDMQFDACARFDDSAMQMIVRKYKDAGYEAPSIVFWNLNAADNVPVKYDQRGAALVSGFSPSIVKAVLSADTEQFTPEGIMLKTIMVPRYDL
jgi:spermidine/putrescine transport system ATP-binding protein